MSSRSENILFVVHGFPPEFRGGTELYAVSLARELQGRGHEVCIFTGSMEGRDTAQVERSTFEGLDVYRVHRQGLYVDNWDKSYAPDVEVLFQEVIDEVQPDAIHVHHWIRLSRTLVSVATGCGVPTVVTLHDLWSNCPRCFRIRDGEFCTRDVSVESCLDCVPRDSWHGDEEISAEIELFRDDFLEELRLAGAVIVPSDAHGKLVADKCGLKSGVLTVIPHGTITQLTSAEPTEPGQSDGGETIRIAHWGHLYPMKGFHLVLEALRTLDDEMRGRFDVHCYGQTFDDEYRAKLDELSEGLRVTWHGAYNPGDLKSLDTDWVVLPSFAHESYSFVLDEAFALGYPVIASDRGALGGRVGDAGLLFAAEDAEALAGVFRRVAEEPDLKQRCRSKVPGLASMSAHAEVLEGIYQRVRIHAAKKGLADLDPALERRRRVQWSYRMETRIRQLFDARGLVDKEKDRSSGLLEVFDKSEEAVSGRERHIHDLESSIAQFRSEMERLEGEVGVLEGTNQNLLKEAKQYEKAAINHVKELKAAHGSQFDESRDLALKELATARDVISDREGRVVDLQAEVEEAAEAITDRDRRLVESGRFLEEALAAVEDYRSVVAGGERTVEDLRGVLSAAHAEEDKLQKRVAKVEGEMTALGENLEETRTLSLSLQGDIKGRDERIEGLLKEHDALAHRMSREKAHAHEVALENKKLEGRAIALQVQLDDQGARASALVDRLGGLVRELGVETGPCGGHPLADLDLLLGIFLPIVIESRNLMGEMAGSVEKLSAESQVIEDERARVQEQLDAELAERAHRRRRGWFRLAERLAGGKKDDFSAPVSLEGPRRGMRIVMVIHDFLPRHAAGSEIYTYRLAQALSVSNEVWIVYTEARQGVHSYFTTDGQYEGIPTIEISHQHTTRYFERTWRDPQMNRIWEQILVRLRPDVVHIQHLHHHSIDYAPIAKTWGIPVVYTLHEYMLLCPRGGQMMREDLERCEKPVPEKCADCIGHLSLDAAPEGEGRAGLSSRIARHLPFEMKAGLKRLLPSRGEKQPAAVSGSGDYADAIARRLESIKEAIRDVNLFISPSRFLRQKFIDCGMVEADRIIFSDNGQDPAPFANVARRTSEELRVGYIGTIADYKGVHVIVDAMNLVEDLPTLSCDVWGGLESFPEYAQELAQRSRNPRTRLRGRYVPGDVGKVLGDLDAIIVPSLWYENSPLTIHEAFMANIPVIASRLGGMAEFVHHEENGLLFETGDAADLAAQLRRLDQDRSLLQSLKNERVEVKTIEDDARDMEKRYRDLVEAARAKSPKP